MNSELWVVYQAAFKGQAIAPNAICQQHEWEEMERANPGRNRLIQSGILHEGQAERIARGSSGDSVQRNIVPPMPRL